ncbi:MAG: methyl-accepting chemotaxis protein [Spirochaetaceae bacterium]|jgi:methyl-accepting chemotaxis protein|nr:methyl-accepting chemotaxis protein [Spirochaetaceae bacterium]
MKKFVDRIFLEKFKHDGVEESYNQAKALVYIVFFLNLVILLLFFIIEEKEARIPFLVIFVTNFVLLYIIHKGNHYITGLIAIAMLSVMFSFIAVLGDFRFVYEIYQLFGLQLFIMILTLLITTRRLHVLFPMVIGSVTSIYIYIFRALPANMGGSAPAIDDYIIAISLLLFSGFIVMSTNVRGRRLISKIEMELEINRLKASKMQSIIDRLQGDFNTGDKMVESSTLVSEYVEEIRSSIESVRDEMNTLSISVIKLNDASISIKESSTNVSHAVEDQSAIIEESSSSVTEMAVSIENISKIANERKTIIEKLSSGSKEAGEAIESAADSMNSLKNLISSMEEINNVINGISEQTSLLAMNAAIEAAHAGEAGKGFAVVAEEVRKLSENSGENVQLISKQLNEFGDSISLANEMNKTALKAYESMSKDIIDVVRGMDEIIYGVNELSAGTSEINSGTSQSVNSTSDVKAGVLIVNDRIREISDALTILDQASSSVLSSVEETIRKLSLVENEAESMKSIGQLNADNLKTLGDKISSIQG